VGGSVGEVGRLDGSSRVHDLPVGQTHTHCNVSGITCRIWWNRQHVWRKECGDMSVRVAFLNELLSLHAQIYTDMLQHQFFPNLILIKTLAARA
jgi:hypothetical protein